jgi:FkbM family methyltransferase
MSNSNSETRKPRSRMGVNIKTILGDAIHWDTIKLPLNGCSAQDPTQLWRCRKHKRIEATNMLQLAHNASVVDCGAHFGDTTLTLAVHARAQGRDDLRFFCLEPSRRKCKFIRSMVKKNSLKNVTIVNACVGDVCRGVRPVQEARFDRYDGRVAYQEELTTTESSSNTDRNDDREVTPADIYFRSSTCIDYSCEDSGSESGSSSEEEEKPIRMISLDSMKEEILPLGLLHLDVEGWEPRALLGAREILEQTSAGTKCFVVAEVWNERDCKRRGMGEAKPDDGVIAAMQQHPHFQRVDDIVDVERNLVFECISEEQLRG